VSGPRPSEARLENVVGSERQKPSSKLPLRAHQHARDRRLEIVVGRPVPPAAALLSMNQIMFDTVIVTVAMSLPAVFVIV
jgi:hypothetical protein